jgi:hypothetical protein
MAVLVMTPSNNEHILAHEQMNWYHGFYVQNLFPYSMPCKNDICMTKKPIDDITDIFARNKRFSVFYPIAFIKRAF